MGTRSFPKPDMHLPDFTRFDSDQLNNKVGTGIVNSTPTCPIAIREKEREGCSHWDYLQVIFKKAAWDTIWKVILSHGVFFKKFVPSSFSYLLNLWANFLIVFLSSPEIQFFWTKSFRVFLSCPKNTHYSRFIYSPSIWLPGWLNAVNKKSNNSW